MKKKKTRKKEKPKIHIGSGANRVLPDGTYATQSAFMESYAVEDSKTTGASNVPHLRSLILGGDFFLGSVLGATLSKLALKSLDHDLDQITKNLIVVEVLSILTAILKLGASSIPPNPIDADSYDRIIMCIRVLTDPSPATKLILLKECRIAFTKLLKETEKNKPTQNKKKEINCQVDDTIKIRQLKTQRTFGLEEFEDYDDSDVTKAMGLEETKEDYSKILNRIYQLTGFSDPLYSEAIVNVHQYDIVLDVLVVNQTNETLQNVCLELSTLGDLKLVERPQNHTIGPLDKKQIKANIKVSSTETGIIFGNIVYDVAGQSSSDKNCVILNDIHIDIMDYISPAYCTEIKFRTMWAEFEWENKVAVNTNIDDVNAFMKHIIKSTNMHCLTPESALAGECGFLSANLYAKSVFGEDALANVSIEKSPGSKISGYIRIRSKTQGIALSLGEKITLKQRISPEGKA